MTSLCRDLTLLDWVRQADESLCKRDRSCRCTLLITFGRLSYFSNEYLASFTFLESLRSLALGFVWANEICLRFQRAQVVRELTNPDCHYYLDQMTD